MTADSGPRATPRARAKRLAKEPIEEVVPVLHDSVFGMLVDPLEPAVGADAPDHNTQRSATTTRCEPGFVRPQGRART